MVKFTKINNSYISKCNEIEQKIVDEYINMVSEQINSDIKEMLLKNPNKNIDDISIVATAPKGMENGMFGSDIIIKFKE